MRLCKCSFLNFSLPFHDGGRYHIETSPLICSANQWTGFYMITASVMKELKWGKNEEKCWVQHILWTSKILFCFWIEAYIFFSNAHIRNVVSTLPDVENDNVVWMLSNVVQFNVEKPNVVLHCKFQPWHTQSCFNVDVTLCDVTASYQPKNNVEPTFKCLLGSSHGWSI